MLTDFVLVGVIGSALPIALAPAPFSVLPQLRYPSGATFIGSEGWREAARLGAAQDQLAPYGQNRS